VLEALETAFQIMQKVELYGWKRHRTS
jgi:hypothetical protein